MTFHAKCDHASDCHNYSGPVFDNECLPTIDESPGWYRTSSPLPPYEDWWFCPEHAAEGRRVHAFLTALHGK